MLMRTKVSTHMETVDLLSQRKADDYGEVELELDELDVTRAETKATYAEIKDYVFKEHGWMVFSANSQSKCFKVYVLPASDMV